MHSCVGGELRWTSASMRRTKQEGIEMEQPMSAPQEAAQPGSGMGIREQKGLSRTRTAPIDDGRARLAAQKAELFGTLLDIRAKVQTLQELLQEITTKHKAADIVTEAGRVMAARENDIDRLIQAVRSVLDANPLIHEWCADYVSIIEDAWLRIPRNWPAVGWLPEKIDKSISDLEGFLHEIILKCGQLVIPVRVSQHLNELRVGQPLDFHATFRDELSSEEDRITLLKFMKAHESALKIGVVDVGAGQIFRTASSSHRRALSFILIGLVVAGGLVLTYAIANLSNWFSLPGWPVTSSRWGELLAGYLFLVGGAAAHTLVGALKQARLKQTQSFLALEDWVLWVHVKEAAILAGVFSLWVGMFGLIFLSPVISWSTAFFVGFSLDSFVDLFIQRFTTIASSRVKEITSTIP